MSRGIIQMTKAELASIPAVPYTETWHPVHHAEVIETVDKALEERNLPVNNMSIEVTKGGKDMFANYYLPTDFHKTDGHADQIVIGIRNSMAKRFALGCVGGNSVMNCSNMCFWGDWEEHRRHTNGLTEVVIYEFLRRAIEGSITRSDTFRDWFKGLANHALTLEARKVLTYDAIEKGVLAPSQWNKFHDAYAEELKSNRDGSVENLAHFHGAATRVMREGSLPTVMDRSRRLNTMIEAKLAPVEFADEYGAAWNAAWNRKAA